MSGLGYLTEHDKQVIALRVCQLMRDMDLRCRGFLENEEWVHFALLNRHSDMEAVQINSSLREALKRHPQLLEDLQRLFKAADVERSGRLTFQEVEQMYSRKLWHIHPSADLLSEAELQSGDPEQFARDIIKAMDVDGDETISYAEFMAFCLGRRKQQVTLHLYDLSHGMGDSLTTLLGEELRHIWHTGLVVYGREYFWASDTVHDVPGETSFGKPTKVINLGFTLWRQDELHDYIVAELQPIFKREFYDHITNNCNHFSDRLCMYLLGTRLPNEVLQQTEHLMKLTTVKLLRPFLQWYCRENLGPGNGSPVTKASKWEPVELDTHLATGTIVGLHPVASLDGPVVLGVVCDPILDNPKRVHRGSPNRDSMGGFAFCSCNSSNQTPTDEVWIRYFDISLNESLRSCEGHVRAEPVPRSQVSVARQLEPDEESVYHAAMLMMNASTSSRRIVGASSGLSRPSPSILPSMGREEDFFDEVLDVPLSSALGKNGSGTLWAAMASPPPWARTTRELEAVQKLVARGHDMQAASAALSSMDWQVEEAGALLIARERLRQAVAMNEAVCPLRPRLGPQPRLSPAELGGGRSQLSGKLQAKNVPAAGNRNRLDKAMADEPADVDVPELPRNWEGKGVDSNSDAWAGGTLTI